MAENTRFMKGSPEGGLGCHFRGGSAQVFGTDFTAVLLPILAESQMLNVVWKLGFPGSGDAGPAATGGSDKGTDKFVDKHDDSQMVQMVRGLGDGRLTARHVW